MYSVEKIDTRNKPQTKQFIQFHYDLYKNCPQWVPPFYSDIHMMLNREKHPFYEHSEADFFVVKDQKEVLGRIAVFENKPFNKYHGTAQAQFTLIDFVEDKQVINLLFDAAFDWARKRGLNCMVGTKGLGSFDGYGVLVEGFEYRQMMNMMAYNYPYYPAMLEELGFEKEVDFVSCSLDPQNFQLDERIREVARRVQARGTFEVKQFKNKKEIREWINRVGKAYNDTFVNNWEYYPLTEKEVRFLMDSLITVIQPDLIKVITCEDKIVGFLLAFPDVSTAMQRGHGHLTPISIVDLMLEMKKTKIVALNGVGVLPEYHGRGGNALLYSEMENTLVHSRFLDADLIQVAETTKQMRKDLENLGAKPIINHRVYHREI